MLVQVPKGAWFPLVLAACIMAACVVWHSSYIKTLRFHSRHAKQLSALLAPQEADQDSSSNPSVYVVSSRTIRCHGRCWAGEIVQLTEMIETCPAGSHL